ncbi:biopolymer transporter ExbD [Paraburkholderia sp. BL21I4N1]|uniref:ExbD/TolR family protein n=1 Tax=Paraburkholderia sp. BL21I4N1 TaxID=1938801 RepID=UPI000CFB3754|nr:biopolymer transporter ExbD [Paraburkholderia sp. BL21I4N1]PQV46671.1 outer membrane transport energization protein ExbD [Paraburkholderia sp. BL21I4N1]
MGMKVGQDGDDEIIAAINTTPLVDVMLVLLIIFLITIPVVTHTVPVQLPTQTVSPLQTKPDSVEIAVNKDGDLFWNEKQVDAPTLLARLEAASVKLPQPEVRVRGDQATRYEFIGRVVTACERAGISKVSFITQPPARGG